MARKNRPARADHKSLREANEQCNRLMNTIGAIQTNFIKLQKQHERTLDLLEEATEMLDAVEFDYECPHCGEESLATLKGEV